MRRLAEKYSAAAARRRWAREVMRLMLPKKGRPLGPGIGGDDVFGDAGVIWYFPHAGPPGWAQWKREMVRQRRMARRRMEKKRLF